MSDLAVKQEEAGAHFFRYQCWNVCGSRRGEPALADEHGTGGFKLPLVIDTPDPSVALALAKEYRGERPVINSVTLEENRFAPMVEAAKTCGAAMVALCMDDSGVPDGVERRIELANILTEKLRREGFEPEDIYLDPMVRPVGSGEGYGLEAVRAIQGIEAICRMSISSAGFQ